MNHVLRYLCTFCITRRIDINVKEMAVCAVQFIGLTSLLRLLFWLFSVCVCVCVCVLCVKDTIDVL